MAEVLIIGGLVVALISGGTAAFANHKWPEKPIRVLTNRIVSYGILCTVILMIGGCAYFLAQPCPPDDFVCDAPAMAQAGVLAMGSFIIAALVLVGVPTILVTLNVLRRR